jgi:hypothetical protein
MALSVDVDPVRLNANKKSGLCLGRTTRFDHALAQPKLRFSVDKSHFADLSSKSNKKGRQNTDLLLHHTLPDYIKLFSIKPF